MALAPGLGPWPWPLTLASGPGSAVAIQHLALALALVLALGLAQTPVLPPRAFNLLPDPWALSFARGHLPVDPAFFSLAVSSALLSVPKQLPPFIAYRPSRCFPESGIRCFQLSCLLLASWFQTRKKRQRGANGLRYSGQKTKAELGQGPEGTEQ